jgi:ATP-dependent protease ClpP protease subunit
VRLRRPKAVQSSPWFKIENHAEVSDLFIYGEIGYEVSANDLVVQLAQLEATTLNVRINSPGGDVFDGVAIYNALVNHPAVVNTQIDSLAASAASFIALAGETVTISEFGQMMIHDPYTIGIGNAADLRETADLLDRQGDNIAAIYAKKAGSKASDWRDAMRVETWYSAQEAVVAGLADAVYQGRQAGDDGTGSPEAIAAKWDLSVFAHAGREDAPDPFIPEPASKASEEPEPVEAFDPDSFRMAMLRALGSTYKATHPEPAYLDAGSFRRALEGAAS